MGSPAHPDGMLPKGYLKCLLREIENQFAPGTNQSYSSLPTLDFRVLVVGALLTPLVSMPTLPRRHGHSTPPENETLTQQ